ncbi:hypothetical protein FOL47_010902, partial [Perkinsus chesapeaki]
MAPPKKVATVHGASSSSGNTGQVEVTGQPNPLERAEATLASLPNNGVVELEEQWSHLQSESTYRQLLSISGATANAVIWSRMSYTMGEKNLGPDPSAFHEAYKIARHPQATKDDSFGSEEGFIPFNYDSLCQKLASATARMLGPKWGSYLTVLAAYLPETVVDTALREKLRTSVTTTAANGRVSFNKDAPILLWKKIGEEVNKDQYDQGLVYSYSTDWTTTLKEFYDGLVDRWITFQESESPRENNAVLLLGRWVILRFRRVPLTEAINEERKLAARIASLAQQAGIQTDAFKLDFSLRRKNIALILRSCKKVAGNVGVAELACRIERKAKSETDTTIDQYFGVERFDHTKKDDEEKKRKAQHDSDDHKNEKSRTHVHRHKGDQDHKKNQHRSFFDKENPIYKEVDKDKKTTDSPLAGNARKFSDKRDGKSSLSDKLDVPSEVLQQRRQAGTCLKCGSSTHMVAQCPKVAKSSTEAQINSNKVSAYGVCVAQLFTVNDRVLQVTGTISPEGSFGPELSNNYVRIGLDTYSSHNIICRNVCEAFHLNSLPLQTSLAITVANGKRVYADAIVKVRLSYGGYNPTLSLLVLDDLPGAEVIIGFTFFAQLGVEIRLPQQDPTNKGGLDTSVREQAEAAVYYLYSHLDKWGPCPGAKGYRYRLKSLGSSTINSPSDYSIPLYRSLDEASKKEYNNAISEFINRKWWFPVGERNLEGSLSEIDVITFPLCQKSVSTKVRACSDARLFNSCVGFASYSGWAIDDIVRFVRSRWDPKTYKLTILDLSRAFYKVRLAHGKYLKVKTLGIEYASDRVIFGVRYGPCALAAQVMVLCNAVCTGMLGREVDQQCTSCFIDVIPGLTILPYYDDFIVIGCEKLVDAFEQILCSVVEIVGAEVPEQKKKHLRPGEELFHLGLIWKLSEVNELDISCPKPDAKKLTVNTLLSKRKVFSIAGQSYDPTYCHAEARLIADKLRAWSGSTAGGWDRKYQLTQINEQAVNFLVSKALGNFHDCRHPAIPVEPQYLVGYCDACESGGGCCVITGPSLGSKPQGEGTVLLESHAGTFSVNESKWHVNRKEFVWLLKTLRILITWISKISDRENRIRGIVVYCDNTTATTWSTSSLTRRYDIQAVHRLQEEAREILNYCKKEYNIEIQIKYLPGVLNSYADQLSRLRLSLPTLQPLNSGNGDTKAQLKGKMKCKHVPLPPGRERIACIAISSGNICTLTATPQKSQRLSISSDLVEGLPKLLTATIVSPMKDDNQIQSSESMVGIGDWSIDDMLEYLRKLFSDLNTTDKIKLYGIPLTKVVQGLKSGKYSDEVKSLCYDNAKQMERFKLQDNIIYHRDVKRGMPWLAFLPTPRCHGWAFYRYHSNPHISVHRGSPRVIEAIQKAGFWWPTMVKDIMRWVKACHQCQLGKNYEPLSPQPLVFRRGMRRFTSIQLDFAGPMDSYINPTDLPCPGMAKYLLIIIDEGTRAMLVLPVASTSTLDIIIGLLIWFQVYGIPSSVQLDNAGAHRSDDLAAFSKNWGFTLSFGIARRPQTQGLVEGAIRDVKATIATNLVPPLSVPWYISALMTGVIHNQSALLGTSYSPHALSMGTDLPEETTPTMVSDQLRESNLEYRQRRDERAESAEIHDVLKTAPRFNYKTGDKVRLIRRINNKRIIQGPFEIESSHPSNGYLFKLRGKTNYVSLNQLLPYREDSFVRMGAQPGLCTRTLKEHASVNGA